MSEHTSHMVLHLIPDDETFHKIKVVHFASPYVQRKALHAIEQSSYHDTVQFLEGAKSFKELATLRGHTYF